MDGITVEKTKLLLEEERYPDDANSPTIYKEYECFCGKGKIIEERVVGFNDHYIDIICKNCLKKYHDFIDIYGNDWKIYKKK